MILKNGLNNLKRNNMKFEIIKDNESLEEFAERMEEPKQETLEEAAVINYKKYG